MMKTFGIQFVFAHDATKQAEDLLAALREAFPSREGPTQPWSVVGGEYSLPMTKTTFWVDFGDAVDKAQVEEHLNRLVAKHAPHAQSLRAHEFTDGVEFDSPVPLTDRPDFAIPHQGKHWVGGGVNGWLDGAARSA
jgi:hypothetical protein